MEENPTAGLVDDTSDIEIDYDEDGNPIAPPKKKVSTIKFEMNIILVYQNKIFCQTDFYLLILSIHIHKYKYH